jgi:hypothetical protein
MMGTLKTLMLAALAALRAFPLWIIWRQSEQIENLTDEIFTLENRARPDERLRLDRLRVRLAAARKQHEALLAALAPPEGRPTSPDDSRDIHSPGG